MPIDLEPLIAAHLSVTFPACTICVSHHADVIYEGAWGSIDPDTRSMPVTTETLFDLASVTKLFTTTAFLSLVSEGWAKLDDPLIRVIPEFGSITPRPIEGGQDPHTRQRQPTPPDLAGKTVDPASITFRHLLTHTGGLAPWRDVYTVAGDAPPPPDQPMPPDARRERWQRALAALTTYPFVAPPDGVVRYSDIGLMLLGEAVARLDGSGDLERAIDRRVVQPLGADAAGQILFNPVRDHGRARAGIAPTEDDPTWRQRRVWGEVHDENCCGLGGVTGHAGLFGTARAVAALGQRWLRDPGAFGIAPDLARQATTLQIDSAGTRRGLGFALKAPSDSMAGDRMSQRAYGHSGFTGTTLWIDPEAGVVVALLTNSVYYGRHSQAYASTHSFRRAVHDAIMEQLA
ncbi:MAG: serine hydrolase domain-containing protein [Candidatus Flexifilum sp.]|jgi:CubicO group peptidase (beta-lactamase class C family)